MLYRDISNGRPPSFLDTWILERLSSLGYESTRIRGLKSMEYIKLGYIFDNREMAEREKLDIRKVSKYPENLAVVH